MKARRLTQTAAHAVFADAREFGLALPAMGVAEGRHSLSAHKTARAIIVKSAYKPAG